MKNKFPSLNLLTTLLDAGVNNTIDILMYKLLLLENKIEEDIIVDFVVYQKRINKMCKKYGLCKVTVKRSLKRLASSRLIKIIYDVAFGKMVVHVIPFPGLIDHRNESKTDVSDVVVEENKNQNETEQGTEENEAEQRRIRQQQLIYTNQKAKSLGIDFGKKGLNILIQYPRKELDKVFQHYLFVKDRYSIPSPSGWIISNLKEKWHCGFDEIKAFKSVTSKYFELQDLILEKFGTIPTRCIS